jgi:hypothetical protein
MVIDCVINLYSLTYSSSIFPWTKGFAATLLAIYSSKKDGARFWNYLPDLITILVIIFVFRYVLKGFTTLNVKLKRKFRITGFYPDWATLPTRLYVSLFFAFMLIVIFPYLPGSDSPILEAFLFSWDSFHFWFRITFEYYCRFDTDVHALV